ncbi:MAG TPA: hypothetical protein VN610_01800 [Bryobacteraceae bacterium]|nr:hypothetical protein [Bryobacteraceae bacterium]
MKYWGFFLAKLIVAAAIMLVVGEAIEAMFPRKMFFIVATGEPLAPFMHDLGYTSAMMVFSLFCCGLLYLIVWDQRYRCRTCLRRLRMPVAAGSWPNMFLIGRPRREYICIYGHGTLKVPEEQISGSSKPDWQPHDDDIWKELESLEETKK